MRPHPHPVSKGPLGMRAAFCYGSSRPCRQKWAASPQLSKLSERVRSPVAATGRTGRSARSPRTKGRRGGQRCACRHGRAAAVRRLQRQVGVAAARNGRPVVVRLRGRQAAAAGAGVPPLHGCVFAGAGLGLRQGLELQSVVVIAGIRTPPGCLTRASAAAGSLHYSSCSVPSRVCPGQWDSSTWGAPREAPGDTGDAAPSKASVAPPPRTAAPGPGTLRGISPGSRAWPGKGLLAAAGAPALARTRAISAFSAFAAS